MQHKLYIKLNLRGGGEGVIPTLTVRGAGLVVVRNCVQKITDIVYC